MARYKVINAIHQCIYALPQCEDPNGSGEVEFSLLCYSLLWTEPLNICHRLFLLLVVVIVTCHTLFILLCHVNFQPDTLFCKLN